MARAVWMIELMVRALTDLWSDYWSKAFASTWWGL